VQTANRRIQVRLLNLATLAMNGGPMSKEAPDRIWLQVDPEDDGGASVKRQR